MAGKPTTEAVKVPLSGLHSLIVRNERALWSFVSVEWVLERHCVTPPSLEEASDHAKGLRTAVEFLFETRKVSWMQRVRVAEQEILCDLSQSASSGQVIDDVSPQSAPWPRTLDASEPQWSDSTIVMTSSKKKKLSCLVGFV